MDESPSHLVLKFFFLVVLVLWTIIANALVFVILYKFPKLRTLPNMLVGNLAFADFCLGLTVLPLSAAYSVYNRWTMGKFFCEFWLASDILLCTASIWNLTMIGLDRYCAITKPVKYLERRTTKTALLMILIVWVFSGCVSLAPLVGWRYSSERGNHVLMNNTNGSFACVHFEDLPSYTIYSATLSFFIPTLVMLFVYSSIFCAFKKHKRHQIYRQKVIRRHLESTILQDLSNVMPTSDEFAKSDDEDDLDSNNVSGESSRDQDSPVNRCVRVPEEKELKQVTYSITQRSMRHQRDFKRVGSKRRLNRSNRPPVTYERIVRHKRRKDLRLRTSLMKKPKAISTAKEKRGVKVLGIIMGCFALCWTPFFIMYVTLTYCPNCKERISQNVEAFITWLGYANSAINPIIYTVFSRDYQNALKKLIGMMRTARPPKVTVSKPSN